jgi:RNA polymerase-binding transcription factor DksA
MLSQQQKQRIEQRLLEEREQCSAVLRTLSSELEAGEQATGELTETPTHLADRGSDVQEEEMDVALAERQIERLHLIDEALTRLRETPAEFDRSVVSGAEIPFERLVLLPWTRVRVEEEQEPSPR